MANTMTKRQLEVLVYAAIRRLRKYKERMQTHDTDEAKRIVLKTSGQLEALEDVYSAMQGNPVLLKMIAEE